MMAGIESPNKEQPLIQFEQASRDDMLPSHTTSAGEANGGTTAMRKSLGPGREERSKSAMRVSIAEELGFPPNSDVTLEAVVDFERIVEDDDDDETEEDRVNENVISSKSTTKLNEIDEEDGKVSMRYKSSSVPDDFQLLLASIYVEEAFYGRNGFFVPEKKELRIYYWYNNSWVRFGLFVLIWSNMGLVLFEEPAVGGLAAPYWATMLIEIICLVGYFCRLVHAWAFMPKWRHWKDKKVSIVLGCLLLTLIDMVVYIVLKNTGFSKYAIRWSRVLRPAFMINFSESRQIRRAIRNIRRTLPEISNVLILLLLMISLYSLLGLKLFHRKGLKMADGRPYFNDYFDIFFSLYVLTTTANNPDITIPAYNVSNWYCIFFVIYVIICMYIFVSIFLAVVYKNYRKHLKNEVKAVVYRKRRNLRSAFECIRTKRQGKFVITFHRWRALMHYMAPKMSPVQVMLMWHVLDETSRGFIYFREFMFLADLLSVKMKEMNRRPQFFARIWPSCFNSKVVSFIRKCVEHRYFMYFFDLVIVANAFCIAFDYDGAEIAFLAMFNLEMFLKLYTFGFRKFFTRFWNVFDFLVIGGATVVAILEASLGFSFEGLDVLMVLRVLRLFKIVGNYQRFKVIVNTIMQIGPAILTYGGIMYIFYYIYSVIGMEAFSGYIKDDWPSNTTNHTDIFPPFCGNEKLENSEYVRLKYCGKNFNDVLKSFNLLFDLTVVNQWHVLTDGFVRVTNKAARLYFLSFHLLCVIVVLNIFVAFILEAFMLQYTFSKTKYEAALEKKIEETGAGSERVRSLITNDHPDNPLDENFSIQNYVSKAQVSYKLKKRKTKNAEEILQQMFEDELNEDDLGPDLKDFDELNDAIEQEMEERPRALTIHNIDAQL
eukprot:Seg1455.3 transcript_id=Seg1455.3/GoldUCD/mRNA.D3Y31 product="Two pore calcium channel protein 1" protein_id=Seg1455.3/GoldUCD/D3Y31